MVEGEEFEQRRPPVVWGPLAHILRFLYFGCADAPHDSETTRPEDEEVESAEDEARHAGQTRGVGSQARRGDKCVDPVPSGDSVGGAGAAVKGGDATSDRLRRMEEQLAQALAAQRMSELKAQTLEEDLRKIAAERNSLKSALDMQTSANGAASNVSTSSGIPTPELQPAQGKGISWSSFAPSLFVHKGEASTSNQSSPEQLASAKSSPLKSSAQSTATSPFSSYVASPAPSDANSVTSLGRKARYSREGAELVEVVVYSASGLLGVGLKDMFISMKLGEHRCSTSAKSPSPTAAEGGSLVTWGQTFRIPHFQPLRSLSLRLRLYAKKALGRKHVVGEAHIHLRDLIDAPNGRLHQTWPLSGVVGQVELKLAQIAHSQDTSR